MKLCPHTLQNLRSGAMGETASRARERRERGAARAARRPRLLRLGAAAVAVEERDDCRVALGFGMVPGRLAVLARAPAFTPFLMALKPCGVENFSPLLIGVLFDTVYLLSVWMRVSSLLYC